MDTGKENEYEIEFDDTEFADAVKAAAKTTTEVTTSTEADDSFYRRVLASCDQGIATIDKQIADIKGQAERLFADQQKLTADRQRLATQRNAARISMRYLEDAEAKRQASGS